MQKQKQYGLILTGKDGEKEAPPPSSRKSKKANVFGDDSSDEDAGSNVDWVKQSLKQQAHGSMQQKASIKAMRQALEDDPSVYEYDEVYDDMTQKREEAVKEKKADRKPKYIQSLIQTAKQRELEFELRKERDAQREREKEGDQFADKEKFVTSAFKKKMEELRKMQDDQAYKDAIDDYTDVTKQKDISGFYRQLYKETIKDKDVPSAAGAEDEKVDKGDAEPKDHSQKRKEKSRSRSSSPPAESRQQSSAVPERREVRRSRSHSHEEREESHRHKEKGRHHNSTPPPRSITGGRRDHDHEQRRDRQRDRGDRHRHSRRSRSRSRSRDRQRTWRHRSRSPEHKHQHHRHHQGDRDRGGGNDRDRSKRVLERDRSRSRSPIPPPPPRDRKEKDRKRTISETSSIDPETNNKIKVIQKENWYDVDVEIERNVKKEFYAKRTIGKVFEDALQRYFERKGTTEVRTYK